MAGWNRDLVVAVFRPDGGHRGDGPQIGRIGTGYPVGRKDGKALILTARHVIEAGPGEPGSDVRVRWHAFAGAEFSEDWQPAEIAWLGPDDLDAALLRCAWPEAAAGLPWGIAADRHPGEGDAWSSRGFPQASRWAELRAPSDFGGTLRGMGSQDRHFEIVEEAPPDGDANWAGASGMPVFSGGTIVGIATDVPPKFKGAKAFAAPTWRMLRDEDFCNLLGRDEHRQRLEHARRSIAGWLRPSSAATGAFARVLRLGASAGNDAAERIADALLAAPLENVFRAAIDVRAALAADAGAVEAVDGVVQVVVPAVFDPEVVKLVRAARFSPMTPLVALPAFWRGVAEIIMAGADGRATRYRPRSDGSHFGEGVLSLSPVPEGGRDRDGQQAAADFDEHLRNLVQEHQLEGVVAAFDDYMVEKYGAPELKGRRDISQRDRRNLLVDDVADTVRLSAKNDRLTYYAFVPVARDEQVRAVQRAAIARLKARYGHVVFLELSTDSGLRRAERDRYDAFRTFTP